MPVCFKLRPRLSMHGGKFFIGFFENAAEQAWVVVNDKWVNDDRYWHDLAECLHFHCRSMELEPDNENLARDLKEYYHAADKEAIRSGRPRPSGKMGSGTRDNSRAEP